MSRRNKKSISMFLVSFLGLLVMMKTFTWVLGEHIAKKKIEIPELDAAIFVVIILLMLRIGFVLWRARAQRAKSLGHQIEDSIEGSEVEANSELCAKCGKAVSIKVKRYCLDCPQRFGGKVYCYEHQYQ